MWCKLYVVLLAVVNHAVALNILLLMTEPLRSHYAAVGPLFREFVRRGHSVTVVNNFPDAEPLQNMTFINLERKNFDGFAPMDPKIWANPRLTNYKVGVTIVSNFVEQTCENILTHPKMKALLASKPKYDVVFVEQFETSDCELTYAAVFFDAPIIGLTSHTLLPKSYTSLGIPFNAAADSFYYSIGGPNPSLLYKLEAFLGNFYFSIIKKWQGYRIVSEIFRKHHPDLVVDVDRFARERIKMMFVYQHYSVTGARLTGPRVLDIAGAHIPTLHPVSLDIQGFLSTAEHGAIYVSFGSNLKSSTMSKEMLQHFLGAFKSIPQKVLWKWEDEVPFPLGHDKILHRKWFPQVDVLCHPKVVAFVSHGGMLSISEAAHCGKPVLAVPFFGDQFSNAAALRASGLGQYLYFQDITSETLSNAIKELTTQESKQNAERVSRLWHDRPLPVLDSAVYWTEYVARHHGAPPALPSTHNSWFESALLDVYTVLIAIVLLLVWICYLIYKLIRLIIRIICRKLCKQKAKTQ